MSKMFIESEVGREDGQIHGKPKRNSGRSPIKRDLVSAAGAEKAEQNDPFGQGRSLD